MRSALPTSISGTFRSDKNFRIREKARLQFRAEFFNVLNHTNFGIPNTQTTSAAFGTIRATYPSRQGPVRAEVDLLDAHRPGGARFGGEQRPDARAAREHNEQSGDVPPLPRARGAVGHDRDRWRRHRRGSGYRRGHARLRRAAARTKRFRQRHLQPQHQAGPRRRALPGAGQRIAGDGGAQGARPAAAERAAPGPQSGLRGAELRLVGSSVLRHRAEALQPAGRQIRLRRFAHSLTGGDPGTAAHHQDRRPARRRHLLRRPVRRFPAADQPGGHRFRAGRHAAELRPGHGRSPGTAKASSTACASATSETGEEFEARAPGGDQRHRTVRRRAAPQGGPRGRSR